MTQLETIVDYLTSILEPSKYQDYGPNGIQVDSGQNQIKTVCGSVDSGLSILKEASRLNADLLIVHHGLYWANSNNTITGVFGDKIRTLLEAKCSLYMSHLPLDGNLELGNAVELLRLLGVKQFFPFAYENQISLGAKGELSFTMNLNEIRMMLSDIEGYGPETVLDFGKKEIKSVGVCTGTGGFAMEEAKRLDIDLLISGEPKHANYHQAKELSQNVLFIGHYASETLGVKALLKILENTFNLQTHWISEPTKI